MLVPAASMSTISSIRLLAPIAATLRRCIHSRALLRAPEGRRPISRFQKYAFGRYLEYLRSFQKLLENEFPRAFRIYRVFSVGVKDFLGDVKEFAVIARKVHRAGLRGLSRRQMELYFQQPRDMLRVAPVLLVAALPFAQNVVFPLAYVFPRQLLCRHFWSLQQRAQFTVHEHKKRLWFCRPVFRHLQARTQLVEEPNSRRACKRALSILGSGGRLSVDQVLAMRPAFDGGPFCLDKLSSIQVRRLLKLHSLSVLTVMRRRALREHGELLRHMDAAMFREGLTDMSIEELYYDLTDVARVWQACFLRGLNPQNLPREEMVAWLSQWSAVSAQVDPSGVSLLLHCPVLLGYNQPTNWVLLY